MNRQAHVKLFAVAAMGGCAAFASCDVMIFTDRASWAAAVGGAPIATEDFNSIATGGIAGGATLDTGIIQITRDGSPNGADGDLAISPGTTFGDIDGTNFLDGETGEDPHERVEFGFNGQSIFAFGADFSSPFSGDGIGIQVNNDDIFLVDTISGFDTGFFGIVASSGTFSDVAIVGNPADDVFQELWQADNVSYAVPTPGSAGLLACAGLIAARRRR